MDLLDQDRPCPARHALGSLARGMFIGLVGVLAIGVWAINFEAALTGKGGGGPLVAVVRVILCDAVPLAVLCALYQSVGRNHSFEQTIWAIGRHLFWFLGGFLRPDSRKG